MNKMQLWKPSPLPPPLLPPLPPPPPPPQVKNILYHCVKEAVSALKSASSEADDEAENSWWARGLASYLRSDSPSPPLSPSPRGPGLCRMTRRGRWVADDRLTWKDRCSMNLQFESGGRWRARRPPSSPQSVSARSSELDSRDWTAAVWLWTQGEKKEKKMKQTNNKKKRAVRLLEVSQKAHRAQVGTLYKSPQKQSKLFGRVTCSGASCADTARRSVQQPPSDEETVTVRVPRLSRRSTTRDRGFLLITIASPAPSSKGINLCCSKQFIYI